MDAADRFNPMDYPMAFTWPRLLTRSSTWVGHIPFAMALVEMCKPDRIVELGTLGGDSYCALCQAVDVLKLPTRCTAVDTWAGDAQHVGRYGPEVLDDLRAHHDPLYARFSNLLQKTFDDASHDMPGGSIDLLHIDGFHSYDAVSHDYETWKPKLSRRGVVMFHDTQERGKGFGVWSFWEEICGQFPSMEFTHSHGLGVLAVGADAPASLLRLIACARRDANAVRRFFSHLGEAVEQARLQRTMLENVQRIQQTLNQRKQMIGEPLIPVNPQEAAGAPLRYMDKVMYEIQQVVVADLHQRGFDIHGAPPPPSVA